MIVGSSSILIQNSEMLGTHDISNQFTAKPIFVIQKILRDHALIKIKAKRSKILHALAEIQHRITDQNCYGNVVSIA